MGGMTRHMTMRYLPELLSSLIALACWMIISASRSRLSVSTCTGSMYIRAESGGRPRVLRPTCWYNVCFMVYSFLLAVLAAL